MIDGHGDDTHRYEDIHSNFSSNILPRTDLPGLEQHLRTHLHLIRTYPEPSATTLETLIAETHNIHPDEVLVTSGATDAIHLIAQTFRHNPTYKTFPPTFSEYQDACQQMGYRQSHKAALCWLCNPNNPTGQTHPLHHIQTLAAQHPLLILDQSYETYTLAPMLTPHQALQTGNIIQLHSMTKQYSIPGLRLGYVTAPAPLIRQLRQHYRPWAVNALALQAGKWLLHNATPHIPNLTAHLRETQRLRTRLAQLPGIHLPDAATQTPFFLCTIHPHTAAALKHYLATQHHILIRDASNFRGLTPHHFRLAAQSPEENDTLIAALTQYIQQA